MNVGRLKSTSVLFLLATALIIVSGSAWGLDLISLARINPAKENYVEGELIVKFKDEFASKLQSMDDLHAVIGSTVLQEFAYFPAQHIKLTQGLSVKDAIKLYEQNTAVEYAEPNFIVQLCATYPGEYPNGQGLPYSHSRVQAPLAWDLTQGTKSVAVAVIDTGVDPTHTDFTHIDSTSNLWHDGDLNGYNGITDRYTSAQDPNNLMTDSTGHGTHVSGIIGAAENNSGVVGVNWRTDIFPCKITASSEINISDIHKCIAEIVRKQQARSLNIVAVNASWGIADYSQTLYNDVKLLLDNKILLVAAASNAGKVNGNKENPDNDLIPWYPASFDLPNVISVAATDTSDHLGQWTYWTNQTTLADYGSAYGRRSVHVGAPGVDILSTISSINGYYDSTDIIYPPTACNQQCALSGTSMAAPQVTGLAALIKARILQLGISTENDWKYIKNLIVTGGDDMSSLNLTTVTGKRINAYNSLTCANDGRAFSPLKISTPVVGTQMALSALSIHCYYSEGDIDPLTGHKFIGVLTSAGDYIKLYDDGLTNGDVVDVAADDGIFTGSWTPSQPVTFIQFLTPAQTRTFYLPHYDSLAPSSGSQYAGMPQTFTTVFSDLDTADDIKQAGIALSTGDPANSIIVYYNRLTDKLILNDDTGIPRPECPRGSTNPATISNSLGEVNCNLTTVQKSGNTLTINWSITPKHLFAGTKDIYTYAEDTLGLDTGIIQRGPWTISNPPKIGVFRSGNWVLDKNGSDAWDGIPTDLNFGYGLSTDKPVVGDWNGDGTDTIGIFRDGYFHLRNTNSTGAADYIFSFGVAGDIPVAGDWNGSGVTKIGVFRNGQWFLDSNGNRVWEGCGVDACYTFGLSTDVPATGDWNGDGRTEIGVFRNGLWVLDTNGNGVWEPGIDVSFTFGLSTDKPATGDWNGDGRTEVGTFRGGAWYADLDGNRVWSGCYSDGCYNFGMSGDLPIAGRW